MILRVFALILIFYSTESAIEATEYYGDTDFVRKNNELDAKKARDIISSFVNAWKTSKILPRYQLNNRGQRINMKKFRNSEEEDPNFGLNKMNFLTSRRNKLDKQSLFALENSLDPRPIKKHIRKTDQTEAKTYFGADHNEDDDVSPEMKLASLISKPIYHNVPDNVHHESDDNFKEYMFNNNDDEMNDNNIGLPNDDWRSSRRSVIANSPKSTLRFLAIEDNGDDDEGRNRKFTILTGEQLERIIRQQRNKIPNSRKLIEKQELERILEESGDKKELITDPYNSLSLPVSDSVKTSDIDRKFYKYLPDKFTNSDYQDEASPAEFKLQKKHLWGDIQKRLKRNKIKQHAPRRLTYVKRSMLDSLGENGNSFDAYGSIGQDMSHSMMKIAMDKENPEIKDLPCKQSAQLTGNELTSTKFSNRNAGALLDNSHFQQDMFRPSDNGILQVAPDWPQKRSGLDVRHVLRHKRAALLMKKKILQDSLAKQVTGSKPIKSADVLSTASATSSRSLPARYLGGLPDSRGTESEDGITEDNEEENLDERLAHDSTPLVMKIAQRDGENLHKFWNNEHSAGNGFYTGHGEGPNHAYLGDYFGHGPEEMERDDGVKSLESSPSSEDHHTASLIDSIWDHDLGDDHLGEHSIERHHSGSKIKSYFGSHHSSGILLPTETMDGIDTHWTGHLPHMHGNDYEHSEGHPVDFPPSRIKAIQAIQDDPAIDVELNPHNGIGTPMAGHPHHVHDFHNIGHSFGGINLAPVVGDPVQVEDSREEEYKQHIDNLLSQYHGLEERLRGTGGTLAGHLEQGNFGHHGHHHLHSGYDLYAYKNPWESMRIPYHVPVINHPSGEQEESPPSPLTFEGKTDEKGAPMVEGGKEEGGKGGPLVEGSKISTIKEGKEKGESPKGAKTSDEKAPMPVIPKQRGGPEKSAGKNDDNNSNATIGDSKQILTDNTPKESNSVASDNGKHSQENTGESIKEGGKEADGRTSLKEAENGRGAGKGNESKGTESKDESAANPSQIFENIMNSNGQQSEMLNNLKAALGEQATNPKSLTALQFARLKQLSTMQQALLSSLAKQAVQTSKESKPDTSGSDMNEIKQLIELQNLQQFGAGIKAGSLINTLRQNSLLHSLKAAQENILKNAKGHSAIKESSPKNSKQRDTSKLQSSETEGFFGKLPINSLTSDLGDVGSEKFNSKIHSSASSTTENDATVSELIKQLELSHAKKSVSPVMDNGIKPALSKLLSERLISNLKLKQTHRNKNTGLTTENNSSTNKAYSSIGNEGPIPASTEESANTRTTHGKDKKKRKSLSSNKKLSFEKEKMETGATKANIVSYNGDKIDEDELSKKNTVRKRSH